MFLSEIFKEWYRFRYLFIQDSFSQFTLKYHRAVLGIFWALAKPFTQIAIYYFVFTTIFLFRDILFFPLLAIGIITWTFFTGSVSSASRMLYGKRKMMSQMYFPREILIFTSTMVLLIEYFLALIIAFILFILLTDHFSLLNIDYVGLIYLVFIFVLFTLSCSFIISPLGGIYQDFSYLTDIALNLMFWVTPIIYVLREVPPGVEKILYYNPVGYFIESIRVTIIPNHTVSEGLYNLPIMSIFTFIFFILSLLFFRKYAGKVVEIA